MTSKPVFSQPQLPKMVIFWLFNVNFFQLFHVFTHFFSLLRPNVRSELFLLNILNTYRLLATLFLDSVYVIVSCCLYRAAHPLVITHNTKHLYRIYGPIKRNG